MHLLSPVGPLPASVYWRRRALVLAGVLLLLVLLRACTSGDEPQAEQLRTAQQDTTPQSAPAAAPPAPGTTPSGAGPAPSSPELAGPAPSSPASSGPAPSGPAPSGPAASGPALSGPASSSSPPSSSATSASAPSGFVPPGAQRAERPALCADRDLSAVAGTDATVYPVGSTPRLSLTVRNTGTAPCTRALGPGAVELRVVSGPDRVWSTDDCSPRGPQGVLTLAPRVPRTITTVWPRPPQRAGLHEPGSQSAAGDVPGGGPGRLVRQPGEGLHAHGPLSAPAEVRRARRAPWRPSRFPAGRPGQT